jgi:glycosyltransferase involved in cell wall biosynthesis
VLRILYITDSLMAGGIESQLVDLVTRLDRSRFDPQIVCLYGPTARDLHFAPELAEAGVTVHTLDLGWTPADKLTAVRRIASLTRSVRPDLVQAENYHSNLLSRMAKPLVPQTRLIGTVRGVLTRKQLSYERISHVFCSRYVASADFLKKMLSVGAGVPSHLISVVPNAIDVKRFSAPTNPQLRQQIAPGIPRTFVSMGRISRQKKMHLIPQAFGLLKKRHQLPIDYRVFIVGPVEDMAMQAQLDEAIQADDLSEEIIHHGATLTPVDYYHACDVSILFTTLEGLPIVALESLAAGRPVIISEEANAAGVVEHGKTGWVVRSGDIEHLAETLYTSLTVPDAILAQMRQFCVQRAQEYSIENLVERYTQLYETWCPSTSCRARR